ncbi:Plasma membrane iron permease [Cytospora mali]|uniref:Plasma membrane iron permease n=1 Tax=Cytospora mali TaxID=578113 RepID=A0A194V5L3_CYTMA|nr:Plasma membrane iron permease [Valsa mali var. pyri (nom. inval.)]
MTVNVFSVAIFFICFRESLETSVIVSVLLAFLKQSLSSEGDDATRKRLNRQVWIGVALGLFICICIGAGMIGAFYTLSKDYFASTEDVWEGVFGIIASVIISMMGAALLRVNKMQEKWRVKLKLALESKEKEHHRWSDAGGLMHYIKVWSEKHVMFLLPFVTVLREGLEAVVYIGGVSLTGLPATSFPLAVICGILCGCLVGYIIYKGGHATSMQIFLIISTCFLYLIAAGLFSKAVWYFENYEWGLVIGGDASETGSGPGSYDITKSVWHVNCCNPEMNGGGGWGIFNAILGWQNSATYGTVISYNIYWIFIIICFVGMRYHERHGHLGPFTPLLSCFGLRKRKAASSAVTDVEGSSSGGVMDSEKRVEGRQAVTAVDA